MLKHQDLWESYFPSFVQANEAILNHLMQTAALVKLEAGQQVFVPGSQCENYLLVLEGSVKAQLISEQGREIVLYHAQSGDSCVLTTSCLLSGDPYPAEGVSETQVLAFALPAMAFYRGIEQSATFREFVFKNFAVRLANVMQRMDDLAFSAIDVRLSRILLSAQASPIHKTHQELANELGSAREVVSRHLKRFETKGWVSLTRGAIEIINIAALKNIGSE